MIMNNECWCIIWYCIPESALLLYNFLVLLLGFEQFNTYLI